jgi:hypothetical protein
MRKTIEATWREGFLHPDALVAPKVNDLYTRKSTHIVERIQRLLHINQIAIVIGSVIMWVLLSAGGLPYTGAITCVSWSGLVIVRRLVIAKFVAPDSSLDSYHYLKAFQTWLKNRMARSRSLQRHLYPITFIAFAIGMVASKGGQQFIHDIVAHYPGIWLIHGAPVPIIAVVAVMTIVLELLGGVIFDHDVRAYRRIFGKLDEMVTEMEELRGRDSIRMRPCDD